MTLPAVCGSWEEVHGLDLSKESEKVIAGFTPRRLYGHKADALRAFLAGENICLATKTASGKTLVFYLSALEHITQNDNARVLVIYPLKALGKEREERWKMVSEISGINFTVGRIDGQVSTNSRFPIIQNSRILIMTPYVMHAWFLNNLGDKNIRGFELKFPCCCCFSFYNCYVYVSSSTHSIWVGEFDLLSIMVCPWGICSGARIIQ